MKLSNKALEDFKNSKVYIDIKKVTGSTLINYIVYHNWLNEEINNPKHIKGRDYRNEKVMRYKLYEIEEYTELSVQI